MNKNQTGMYHSYLRSSATELWQVYDNYSTAKARGMEYCKNLQRELNGYDGRITGHSCHFFSYAFRFEHVNEETGVCEEWLCYCTHANDYKFKIKDM